MAHIEIDLLGEDEDKPLVQTKPALEPELEADPNRQLRKQVINIEGEIVAI